ncbi:MAG: hypothetical protein ABJ205_13895 [Erythrobacter sp.]|uniref:hypothetical protein n=1 Tax=Erythrobacter sp. TaxID=1042 RepID=UPI0032660BEC
MKNSVCVRLATILPVSCLTLAVPVAAQDPGPATAALRIQSEEGAVEARTQAKPFTISVRIMGQDRELWAGDLTMSVYNRAQVRLDINDSDIQCPLEDSRFALRRNAIEFQVRPGYGRANSKYTIETNWTRPTGSCSEQGSRVTGFEVQVELEEGKPRVIEGDGGLRVEITRRQ